MHFKIETISAMNKGRKLEGLAHVYPWGDAATLKDTVLKGPRKSETLRAGSYIRPNLKLAEKTGGKTTHQIWVTVHGVLLAGFHVSSRYGIKNPTAGTEMHELDADIDGLRDFSQFLFRVYAYTPEEQERYLASQAERAERYETKVDEAKVAAQERMEEATDFEDSRGRRNPMAKAMVNGVAIGKLMERRQAVRGIGTRYDWRTRYVHMLIREHTNIFGRLWSSLSLRAEGVSMPQENAIFGTCKLQDGAPLLIHPSRGEEGLKQAERLFREQYAIVSGISLRPFVRNALHTKRDLELAIALVQAGNRVELLKLMRKMRRGIRWVFAQNALVMDALIPYAVLLDELKNRTKGKERRPLTRDMARERFDSLDALIAGLIQKIEDKCHDKDLDSGVGLDHEIKDTVLAYLNHARDELAHDRLLPVTDLLEKAVQTI